MIDSAAPYAGGVNMTRARSGRSLAAEAAFRARLAYLDAELLESRWLGANTRHRVRCAAGHECTPRPSDIGQGWGICRVCARNDSAAAEAAFRARLAYLDAELLESRWLGAHKAHRVRCGGGHECRPRPHDLQRGQGICRICARQDTATAEAEFRTRLEQLGATLLEPYRGALKRHRVRCAAGHKCTPRPADVQQGDGICRYCAGKIWDAFYVVRNPDSSGVKFGITSGCPGPRLADHRRAGYRERVLVLEGLPGTAAPEIERAAIAALALAGVKPLRGREHFGGEALAVVLDIAAGYAAAA
jgi:hypothetical protein